MLLFHVQNVFHNGNKNGHATLSHAVEIVGNLSKSCILDIIAIISYYINQDIYFQENLR